MVSPTLVACMELAVEDDSGTTITEDLVDDELDETEVDKKEVAGVLGEVLTEEDEGVVEPPAVPEGATLSW